MTATQRCGGNETATVMDGDGQSDSNASATTAMEGVTVMDGTTAMAINGATQCGGNDNNGSNGWRGGNGDCNVSGSSFDTDVFVYRGWLREQVGLDLDAFLFCPVP